MRPDPAVSADGLLRQFTDLGLLTWGSVHTAKQVCFLYGEDDQRVQLAFALLVRALTSGSVCVNLSEISETAFDVDEQAVVVPADAWPEAGGWREALLASPAVAVGADAPTGRPLRMVGDLLYLERYWVEETKVARILTDRSASGTTGVSRYQVGDTLSRVFEPEHDQHQVLAAAVSLLSPTVVVAGGPGTGKTTTIARILTALSLTYGPGLRIALAAPTGKAAARMDEAIAESLRHLPPGSSQSAASWGQATTLHRLLGWRPDSRTRFAHDHTRPLPHDVVVVDEASMVPLTMMSRLLDALRPEARLVLVGDPDQLAPVDAGAVLADICAAELREEPQLAEALLAAGLPRSGSVVRLRTNFRFTGAIDELAQAVLAGDEDAAVAIATRGDPELRLAQTEAETDLAGQVTRSGLDMLRAARRGEVEAALTAMDQHRLLCAHRTGPFGVSWWSRKVESWLVSADDSLRMAGEWYPGRPLLVTANAPDVGVYNGDTGVVVQTGKVLRAHFNRAGRPFSVSPHLLDAVQTVYAMTVHKAQGSQFKKVTIILPPPDSPLLTRELLYTALTRASEQVTMIGSTESLRLGVRQRAPRASGLSARL